MNDFARVMVHPRYGQILAIKVAYEPRIDVHCEVSGVRIIMHIDMTNHKSGKPFRAMLDFWGMINADNLACLLDEYRENSPELQKEVDKANRVRMSPEAADFKWVPNVGNKDESD